MTDQEQIAEMAVLGCVRNPQAHTAEECAKCDFKHGMCNAYRHAEALYNTGYRKLPEDSVVLSREEQEKILKATESRINKLKEQVKQERKETAEKIYTKIKDSFLMNSNNCYALKLWIEEQFGLEIKE